MDTADDRAAAFEALSLPLADMLYATAFRMTGDAARAEDLVQEALVCAWQKFDQFTPGTNFKAWIFKFLVFLQRNEHRARRHQPVSLDALPIAVPAPDSQDASGGVRDWPALLEDTVDDEFKAALAALDEEPRAVLLFVSLGELTYQECADALGIPIGTVMSHLFRARKKLQGLLEGYARERGLTGRRTGVVQ